MKRKGHLFERAFTKDTLLAAYYAASKHKHGRRGCFEFEKNLGAQLDMLFKELHSGTYNPKPYYTFTIYEQKKRIIHAPAFRQPITLKRLYNNLLQILIH